MDSTRRRRLLIVDDSKAVRMLLVAMLEAEFDCHATCSPVDALAAMKTIDPDLVLTDLEMMPFDGYELCRRIRALELPVTVPIIMLTARDDPEGRALGLEHGADDYLNKPIKSRELLARVRSLLRLRDALQQSAEASAKLARAHDDVLRAQQQMVEAEKLATLGTLAAGVAHEINNPLAYVMSGVRTAFDLLGDNVPPEEVSELEDIRSDVLSGMERIQTIVKDLSLLARDQHRGPSPVGVVHEIEQALRMAGPRLNGIRVARQLGPVSQLRAVPGYVNQIVLNLVLNAADALRDAGCADPVITVSCASAQGGVEITVADNGQGMGPELLSQVMEPFFTTKPAGRGTGLGLSVCMNLARRMSGELTLSSQLGVGTRGRLWLPLDAPAKTLDRSAAIRV